MRIVSTLEEMRHQITVARSRGDRIGLVPSRGNLHVGHIALLRAARAQCDLVVCSIVAAGRSYSPVSTTDRSRATDAGTDIVWAPEQSRLHDRLLGGERHHRSHAKVVFADQPQLSDTATADVRTIGIVQPDVVYVGESHFEHARLLSHVVEDLALPVEVRVIATPRDPDGVPVGSIHSNLTAQQAQLARILPAGLDAAAAAAAHGETSLFRICARVEGVLANAPMGLQVLDVAAVDPATFAPIDVFDQPALIVISAEVSGTAIVDSRVVSPTPAPAI